MAALDSTIITLALPLMFQVGMGVSALAAGMLLLGWNGCDLAMKSVAGRVLRRFGFRSSLVASASMTAASTAACMVFGDATPLWMVFAILVLNGAAAISLSAITLNLSAMMRHGNGSLSVGDCRVSLLILSLVGFAALTSFLRLPRDAGVAVSAHAVE